jgi:hypothetical protein
MGIKVSTKGLLAHVHTPDEALELARKVRDSKWSHFDILTPFPIHGIEDAMGVKPSWIPYVSAALAFFGIALAQAFINYVMVGDWPMDFGGKPHFAWPSFLPVTFESMVFYGAIGSAVVAIVAGKKDTVPQPPPMAIPTGATQDKFVLWISATDPKWDEAEVVAFVAATGAEDVRIVDAGGAA